MNYTKPQLCIGSAQFGLDYGITNDKGKVSTSEIKCILNTACKNSIQMIDTAQGYGEAESIIGRLNIKNRGMAITTKMSGKMDQSEWEANLQRSLKRLNVKNIETLMLHDTADLKGSKKKRLLSWMNNAKERGLINKIGISIYDEENIKGIDLSGIQVVQVPASVYDQRLFRSGKIKALGEIGIKIHIRSLFLQGLILQKENKWPKFLSQEFKDHHRQWRSKLNQEGLSQLMGAIKYCPYDENVEALIVGITSTKELQEIISAYKQVNGSAKNSEQWMWNIKEEIDPRAWPKN